MDPGLVIDPATNPWAREEIAFGMAPMSSTAVGTDGGALPAELLADGRAVGATLRVLTRVGQSVEGVVFTLDPVASFLFLEERVDGSPSKSKTHIFQLSALEKVEVLVPAPADANLSLPSISEEELLRVEQRNKLQAERALASIGKGVSSEAQAIFDALNKTMPCEWEGASIRVMGEVVIKPPYQPQNCVSSNAPVLSRVKKVLEGEKSKLNKRK